MTIYLKLGQSTILFKNNYSQLIEETTIHRIQLKFFVNIAWPLDLQDFAVRALRSHPDIIPYSSLKARTARERLIYSWWENMDDIDQLIS